MSWIEFIISAALVVVFILEMALIYNRGLGF